MDTKEAGKKGGEITALKGKEYFQNLQRLSAIAKRKRILGLMKVEDLDNPVTKASLTEALELNDRLLN